MTRPALPLEVEPPASATEAPGPAIDWICSRLGWLDDQVLHHGAVLLRCLGLRSVADFVAFLDVVEPERGCYAGGNSPRQRIAPGVYTSTEYPPEYEISLHNELSYAKEWPSRLYFFCLCPAAEGGETPLADSRRILARLDSAVRDRFATQGVRYVQNLHGGRGLGKSWQQTFETDDRAAVEAHCRAADVVWRWTPDGGCATSQCRPALATHPRTAEQVWFNQAEQWHVSSLDAETQRLLATVLGEDRLPLNAFYGDGEIIAAEDLDDVRAALRAEAVAFPWRRGDVLVVDNMLVAHGRRPFRGERRVLVAMSAA